MNKTVLRSQIRHKLKELTLEEKALLDKAVYDNFLKLNLQGKNICLYNHLPSEIETYSIFKQFVEVSNIFMPVVIGSDMEFVKVDENTEFTIGPFNIKEPIGERFKSSDLDIDLCITPMLGADRKMNRLGKGKGYYDKFFAQVNCFKVGLCYDFALVDSIDCEDHDIKMDIIVTDREILK